VITGFEFSNRPDGTITPEEWQRWDALPGKVAKLRPYNCNRATLDYIAPSHPTIILRPSADGDIDVEARVNDLQPALVQLLQWEFQEIVVIPDNEPQLGNRPYVPGYWEKVMELIAHPALRDLWGEKVRVASPPLAVMQGEEEWYDAAGPELLGAFDYLSVHLYGQTDNGFVHRSLALARQFNVPLIADEVGDSHETASQELKAVSVASYLRIACESGVKMATLFQLGGSWTTFHFDPSIIERCIRPVIEFINSNQAAG
jgi:hypothetical protein